MKSSQFREQGQIEKTLKPSMAARPAPSLARDAFLLCPCSLHVEFICCCQMYSDLGFQRQKKSDDSLFFFA
ncbi:hypothetical protein T296_05205 [Pantoea agglomerans Eh318]|nr:hypothetical protein T296_05205 [Pantoea agglomerans Eh318]